MRTLFLSINTILMLSFLVVVVPLWGGYIQGKSTLLYLRPLEQYLASQRQDVANKAKITTLNLYMPASYKFLIDLLNNQVDPQTIDFDRHTDYYRASAEILPRPFNADSFAMLAFCYYHQKKLNESLVMYLRAFDENPAFIWTSYNLAILAFQAQDYVKATMMANAVLKMNPEFSLKIVTSSKIYTDILAQAKGAIDLTEELKKTYSNTVRLLVVSLFRLQQYSDVLTLLQSPIASEMLSKEFRDYYFGLSYKALGQDQTARDYLEKVPASLQPFLQAQDVSVRFF